MRLVVQRVKQARVEVGGELVGKIREGLLLLLGVKSSDSIEDVEYLVEKVLGLRIFEDHAGKMNLSIMDKGGEILVVSQFTLYGDCRKGRRPSFDEAAPMGLAMNLYDLFVEKIKEKGLRVETGRFGAVMDVNLINSGPVTLLLDSNKVF
ncbi:MAG TPA: D-aminoacyl-tRNA deacylase [Thermodesulfobacteriota bacterium]|jgi:D-tyrosyl-tRNA(Tyr) deacylase